MKQDRTEMVEFLKSRSGKMPAGNQPLAVDPKQGVPKSRQGKVGILTYHSPEVAKQLKLLAAETGLTQGQLVAEGLNMVFAKHNKSQIAG
jgi:hypothetical protein